MRRCSHLLVVVLWGRAALFLPLGCGGGSEVPRAPDGGGDHDRDRDAEGPGDAEVIEENARDAQLEDAAADAEPTDSAVHEAPELSVMLNSGPIQGRAEGETRLFLGIPYAKPPVGALRFAPPEPVEPWVAKRLVTDYGSSCPQPSGSVKGAVAEDCLTLNVFTPREPPAGGAPVMVFLHGGGFGTGGAVGYPSQWLSGPTQTVVVTVNYRLGPLGFLAHAAIEEGIGTTSGNMGLRDQQLALAWVRQNIALFGGDPENIALFGESAGALSTCLHMFMPGSANLAHRFIMESGACVAGSLRPRSRETSVQEGIAFVDRVCPSSPDVLQCLRDLPSEALVGKTFTDAASGSNGPSWPHVDGVLIPRRPLDMLRAGEVHGGPILAGSNERESALYQQYGFPHLSNRLELLGMFMAMLPNWLEVYQHYVPANDADAHEAFVRAMTDEQFRCPTRMLVREAEAQGIPAYLYSFEVRPAVHSLELDYVFGWPSGGVSESFPDEAPIPPTPSLVTAVQSYWGTFARSGDPNSGKHLVWPRYAIEQDAHLRLAAPLGVGEGLARADCDFWEAIQANAP